MSGEDLSGGDKELSYIAVLPGGSSEDVTPGPRGASLVNIGDNNILLGFEDDPRDLPLPQFSTAFEFYSRHVPLTQPTSKRFQIRGGGCKGFCEAELPNKPENSEFVIVGFRMFYTASPREHDSDQIGIVEQDGIVQIGINDKNSDDVFSYDLEYTWVSKDDRTVVVKEHKEEIRGKCRTAPTIPIKETDSLRAISGFLFDYVEGDHEIAEIRIAFGTETDYLDNRIEDTLHLSYRDQNCDGDDRDLWVRWVEIGPSRFTFANQHKKMTIEP